MLLHGSQNPEITHGAGDQLAVALSGPTYEEPRRWWRGPPSKALDLLAPLPDGTDLDTIWRALHAVT